LNVWFTFHSVSFVRLIVVLCCFRLRFTLLGALFDCPVDSFLRYRFTLVVPFVVGFFCRCSLLLWFGRWVRLVRSVPGFTRVVVVVLFVCSLVYVSTFVRVDVYVVAVCFLIVPFVLDSVVVRSFTLVIVSWFALRFGRSLRSRFIPRSVTFCVLVYSLRC